MKDAEDAYGHSMMDYYQGKGGRELVERSDGYLDPSAVAPGLYFSPFEQWPEVERKAIRFARGKALDVGCGAGRVSLYLQQLGHPVVGIDVSPLVVRVARSRGVRDARTVALQNARFPPKTFDSIVMFGNNFGLFGSRAGARRTLRRLHGMTSDGALLIGESVDPYKTDNPDHLAYQKLNRSKGRMSGQVKIRIRYRTFVGGWFDYLLVSQDEMEQVAEGTGWRVREFVTAKGGALYAGVLERV